VLVVNKQRVECPRNRCLIVGRDKRFLSPGILPDRLWGPPSRLLNWDRSEGYHSSSLSAEVKNEWNFTSICRHDLHRDNLTVTYCYLLQIKICFIYLQFLNQNSEYTKSSEEIVIEYWREYEKKVALDYLRYYPAIFLKVLWKSMNIPSTDSWFHKSSFEPVSFRIQSYSTAHSTVTFGSRYKNYMCLGVVIYS